MQDVLVATEVAELLRMCVKTVYRLAETGVIPGKRIGRSWRFRHGDIVKFLGEQKPIITAVVQPGCSTGILATWPKQAIK